MRITTIARYRKNAYITAAVSRREFSSHCDLAIKFIKDRTGITGKLQYKAVDDNDDFFRYCIIIEHHEPVEVLQAFRYSFPLPLDDIYPDAHIESILMETGFVPDEK